MQCHTKNAAGLKRRDHEFEHQQHTWKRTAPCFDKFTWTVKKALFPRTLAVSCHPSAIVGDRKLTRKLSKVQVDSQRP